MCICYGGGGGGGVGLVFGKAIVRVFQDGTLLEQSKKTAFWIILAS